MKLSMWMLADQLGQYDPEPDIRSGTRCLQSARLFTEDMNFSPFSAYVTQIESNRAVVANKNDILTLHTDDVSGALNDVLNIFDFYYSCELAFENAIAQGCSSLDLLRLFSEKTGYFFIFADATFYMRDFCGPEDIHHAQPNLQQFLHRQMLSPDVLHQINAQPQIRQKDVLPYAVTVPELGTALTCNLFSGGTHRGWLIAANGRESFSRGEADLIQMLGEFLSAWIERNDQLQDRTLKAGLFLQLLNGEYESIAKINERLEPFGWCENDPKQIYVFRPVFEGAGAAAWARTPDRSHSPVTVSGLPASVQEGSVRSPAPVSAILLHLENRYPSTFVFRYENTPVMVTDLALLDGQTLTIQLTHLLENSGYVAGESPQFTALADLRSYYDAALLAAEFAQEKAGQILRFQESVLPYTFTLLKQHAISDLRHPALEILAAYDARHGAELYRTLSVFLTEERNYTATAQKLNIHRSTLLYRIDRILEMTGIDFSNADERFHLLLSFRLDQ